MSNNRILVPEAREALDQYKLEYAKELCIEGSFLASRDKGISVRKLIEIGEKQLTDNSQSK